MRKHLVLKLILLNLIFFSCSQKEEQLNTFDVVVYGGTSAGVVTAYQAVKMGKTAVIIGPGKDLGGLTSGGLGATDIGNKAAIGGLFRVFYQRINQHYNPGSPKEETMWTFEPHVAEKIFNDLLEEAQIKVLFNERLDLKKGVGKIDQKIQTITTESGLIFKGKMFIDATYEGDLMATAGVSFAIGRESNNTYNKTLNGFQTTQALNHQFKKPVDPFITSGKPESELLPGILKDGGSGMEGKGDQRIQVCLLRQPLFWPLTRIKTFNK